MEKGKFNSPSDRYEVLSALARKRNLYNLVFLGLVHEFDEFWEASWL